MQYIVRLIAAVYDLILSKAAVGAEGMSYGDAAVVCGVPIGTMKSRVSRGRERLSRLLEIADVEEIGPDQITRAAMQR